MGKSCVDIFRFSAQAYFGFTPEEVRQIADYYGVPEKYPELCRWYDGYRFGKSDIFNPWSVINYFGADCEPQAFWQSTGSNEIIGEILSHADEETYDRLNKLLQGQSFSCPIDTGVIYPQIQCDPSTIFSFLLVAGYLKVLQAGQMVGGERIYEVALPNQEITYVYQKEILQKLNHIIPSSMAFSMHTAICAGDAAKLQSQLRKLLLQSVSYHDTAGENFYHGLVLGLCAMLDGRYQVRSNRESGEGRYDIQLMPKDKHLPGVLIELKAQKDTTPQTLRALAETALTQIHQRQYDTEMTTSGIQTIFRYGIAFDGKNVEIATACNN